MANYQLKKQFREFEPHTAVKVHVIDGPVATISIIGLPKKYLVPKNYIKQTESVGHIVTSIEVSPGRPLLPSNERTLPPIDWVRLEQLQMTYPLADGRTAIKASCYCGQSSAVYPFEEMRALAFEKAAIAKAVADCPHCSEKHSHSTIRSEGVE